MTRRFGSFEANLVTGELRKHGAPLKLQEQPAKILVALLERPGEVIRREELIKRLWADGTFVDYDRGLNAAVTRLRQALSDSAENPRYVETVARRGYRFTAPLQPTDLEERSESRTDSQASAPASRSSQRWTSEVAAVVALSVLLSAYWLLRPQEELPPRLEPVPLTSDDGAERHPSFSPDGTQIAFSWNGRNQDNFDIYVKAVAAGSPQRLTTNPAMDSFPAWSPDGRYVAFHRVREGVYLVPPTGGAERRLIAETGAAGQLSWSGDGKYVAFSRAATKSEAGGIFLIEAQSGEVIRLTRAEAPTSHKSPSFSHDSRSLAFADCASAQSCSLTLVQLDSGLRPRGQLRAVAQRPGTISGIAWTSNSSALVFSELTPALGSRLWKVSAYDGIEPRVLSFARPSSSFAAISRTDRPAYSYEPRSPDGRRIVYDAQTSDGILMAPEPAIL